MTTTRSDMRRGLSKLTSPELQSLLRARDPELYRPEAYTVMEEILSERGEEFADKTEATAAGPKTIPCPFCREQIIKGARKCKHCGSTIAAAEKSDIGAGLLGLFLGPVGLWYKGHWAAGFAWLIIGGLVSVFTFGILAPLFWIGMAVHAAIADPKG